MDGRPPRPHGGGFASEGDHHPTGKNFLERPRSTASPVPDHAAPHPPWPTMSAITETLRPVGPDGSILDSTLPPLPRWLDA